MKIIRRWFFGELQSITGAAILIGASSLLSRFLGVIRERLLVSVFGVGDELDAYFASFQAPNFIYNLLVLGTLSVALIPVFAHYYERDKKEACEIAGAVFNATVAVMGFFSLALFAFAPFFARVAAPGFDGEKMRLTIELTRIAALSPLFFSLSSVFGSVLNARRNFLAGALSPIAYNLSIIFAALFGVSAFGVRSLAYGVVIGAAAHALIQFIPARAIGFRFVSGWRLRRPGVREVWKLFFPRIWGIDISQISLFVGSMIGSTFSVGSVTLFNLANNIQAVPLGVFGVPLAIAAFPVLSSALARGERAEFLQVFSRTARQIAFFLMPLGAITIVLRAHLVRLIIGTESLSWNDTRLAAAALAIFAGSLFFQGLTPLLSRAFYALKNTIIPVIVSGIAVAVFAALVAGFEQLLAGGSPVLPRLQNFLRLVGVPDLRLLGLPLAFSGASAAQALILAAALRVKLGPIGGRHIALSLLKTGAASLLAMFVARVGLYAASLIISDRTFGGVLFQTVVAAFSGVAIFILAALCLKSEEAAIFLGSLKRKMLRVTKPFGFGEAIEAR